MGKRLEPHKLKPVNHIRRLALIGQDFQHWYDTARTDIQSVCSVEHWDLVDFVNKLAILSPRVSVVRNVRITYAYCGQGGVYLGGVVKSIRHAMDNYLTTGIVGGLKVSQFAHALNGDRDAITLDTWMARAIQDTESPTIVNFKRIATRQLAYDRIRKVARQLQVSPRDCQAMIWAGAFREVGHTPVHYPIIREYDRWIEYLRVFPRFGTIGIPAEDDVPIVDDISFDYGSQSF